MSNLPYDTEIEYLENDDSVGYQTYINTGIKPHQDIRGIIDFKMTSATTHGKFYGNNDTYDTTTAYFITYQNGLTSSGKIGGKYGGTTAYNADGPTTNNLRHVFDFNKNVLSIDGTVMKTYTYTNFTGIGNILLLAMAAGCTGRLYSCKIYDDNVLVRDYIPVRIGDVGYLYDKVSGELFANAGTGNFILGNDKTLPNPFGFRRRLLMMSKLYDAEVEYLQSNGNQFFTLPIIPSEATDAFEIEFRRTANTNQQRFCHADSEATFQIYVNGSGRVAYSRNGTWTAAWGNNQGAFGVVKHILKVDYYNKKVTYDCATANISSTTKAATHNLVVTGKYTSNATFKGLIYGIRFWRSGVLMYDLIPVRKSGVGYFFDKVNSVLYANEGTGSWTIGYDKLTSLSSYTRLDYIENTSTEATAPYIDTGISSGAGVIDMSMTVKWNTIDSEKRQLMGSSQGPNWGCDGGEYKTGTISMGLPTPSTTSFDNVDMTTYSGTPPYLQSLGLFKALVPTTRSQTGTTYISLCKLKAYKIKVNNILVRDYVPVLHPAGVYGMFDNVENKFYASATSVGFTGGFDE